MYKNAEGYADETAGQAIHNIIKKEQQHRDNTAGFLIRFIKRSLETKGFELVSPVEIRDIKTGKEYKKKK
jgi:hypothetical protein